jgi:hypothetical protein
MIPARIVANVVIRTHWTRKGRHLSGCQGNTKDFRDIRSLQTRFLTLRKESYADVLDLIPLWIGDGQLLQEFVICLLIQPSYWWRLFEQPDLPFSVRARDRYEIKLP